MSLIVTPLGDAHFYDVGDSVLNDHGFDVPVLTDMWGGSISATIPNPRKSMDQEPMLEPEAPYGYAAPPDASFTYTPQTDLSCLFGCGSVAVQLPDPTAVVPEPASLLLVGIALILAILWRKRTVAMRKLEEEQNA